MLPRITALIARKLLQPKTANKSPLTILAAKTTELLETKKLKTIIIIPLAKPLMRADLAWVNKKPIIPRAEISMPYIK